MRTERRTVSVVIPCFNQARFLRDAIESALAQAGPHVEVVVVDDGSTDDSALVAASYPVRVVRQANCGLAAARNAGAAASTGDVLIFLDADDRLTPGAAAAGLAALDRSPAAAMAFGRCVLIDEAGKPLATNLPRVRSDFYAELLRRNYIWMPAMAACRREAFEGAGGFDRTCNASADYDLYLRLARRYPFAAHDAVVAEYRQHPESMSRNPVLMLDTTLRVLRRHRPLARRTPADRAAYREGVSHWRTFYGERLVETFRAAIRRRDGAREALWCAAQLLRLYPRGVVRHLRRKAAAAARRAFRAIFPTSAGSRHTAREAGPRFRSTHTSHSPSR